MSPADVHSFDRILVPTDFSENAELALAFAASLAAKLGAKLTILHVAHLPGYAFSERTSPSLDELLPRAQDALDRTVERARRTVSAVEGVLEQGHPAERVVEFAKRAAVDLIVMGTHGRRGLPHALMGSVAERVVRTSTVPVMTVSPNART